MFVEDYMTTKLVSVTEQDVLFQAVELMAQHRIRQLPVLDSAKRLTGILTDRDARAAFGFDRTLAEGLTVAEVMTPDPVTIQVSASLDEAMEVLHARRFGALPVLRGRELVGIISYVDVLRAFSEVLGLDQPGHALEIALPEGYADLSRTFQALEDVGGSVISAVVSRLRRDGGEPSLYLRVAPGEAARIERTLRNATLIVLRAEA